MSSVIGIVHVIPSPSIFESVVIQRAEASGHSIFHYGISRNWLKSLADTIRLLKCIWNQPKSIFLFHQVPHFQLIFLTLVVSRFRYGLMYWGRDYYSAFLDEAEFEAHCIRKSRFLNPAYYGVTSAIHDQPLLGLLREIKSKTRVFRSNMRRLACLWVVGRSTVILSLSRKQFRVLRSFYFRAFGRNLTVPQFSTVGYGLTQQPGVVKARRNGDRDGLHILICHSATPAVAPRQTLELLRLYKDRWGVKINISGFLSYSGAGEEYRDDLERELIKAADFAESVFFEKKFLSPGDLEKRLSEIDVAVFSCLRDEGVNLLAQFVGLGGVVAFNRFSFNHDYFLRHSREKVLTHEQFLELSPSSLLFNRYSPAPPPPGYLPYDEFAETLRLILDSRLQ